MALIPLDRPTWPLEAIPPLGVPFVVSKAFWGGVWGALLATMLGPPDWRRVLDELDPGRRGRSVARRFLCGAANQGRAQPALWPRFAAALMLNGFWGFGTALLLRLATPLRR